MRDFLVWFQHTPPAWLFLFTIIVLPLETYVRIRRGMKIDYRVSRTSFIQGFLFLFVAEVFGRLVFLGLALYLYHNYRIFSFPTNNYLWALTFLAYLALDDFIYYWVHRAEHTYAILWSSHLIHHSATDYSFATGVRNPWTEIFYKPFVGLWAPLLGVNPALAVSLGIVSLMGGLLQHTSIIRHMGVLDHILMTPLNHGIHHAKNPEYIDKNFGGTFIFWDKIFGTYARETVEPVYGITKPLRDDNAFTVAKGGFPGLFKEVREQMGFVNKFKCMFSKIS